MDGRYVKHTEVINKHSVVSVVSQSEQICKGVRHLPVGGHRQTGLLVASAGPAGSGGHERVAGAQRVSIIQHPARACGATFSGPEQER